MKKFLRNSYIQAFLYMMLFYALFHFAVLLYTAIVTRSLLPLNVFSILGFGPFLSNMPELFESGEGTLLSFIVVIAIYICIYLLITRKRS